MSHLLDEQWSACEKRCNQAAQKERDDIVAWLIEHTEFGANWAAALERGEHLVGDNVAKKPQPAAGENPPNRT